MGEIDDLIAKINPRYSEDGKPAPVWEHKIVYDTNLNTLEPVYYWLIDYLNGAYAGAEKISDTFAASPGSTYFADLGARATKMQEEGMKIMATVNAVVKSIINLIYDLKNFEIRLKQYDKANSKDPAVKEEGILGLKEIWMNSVDAQRGMGSINNMAHQYGFTTLRPAFMAATSAENVDTMDLNDIVKRILKPRIGEFFDWAKVSEAELRKRYDIEKSYLQNQISTLNLYATWVKPYLTAAEQLRMKEKPTEAALVSVFGQMVLELGLLSKKPLKIDELVLSKDLPPEFLKKAKSIRQFYKLLAIDFVFRTYPTQQAPHAGRLEINFKAYVLNEDELAILNKMREEKNKDSMLNLAQNLSEDSLKKLKEDIDYFLVPKKEEKEEEGSLFKGAYDDFKKTLFGQTMEEKEKERKKKEEEDKAKLAEKVKKLWEEGIPADSHEESVVREFAELDSSVSCFNAFDVFKKAHGLASFPNPFDEPDAYKRIRQRIVEVKAALKK